MFNIPCASCGKDISLSDGLSNFAGEVKCKSCGTTLTIRTVNRKPTVNKVLRKI